MVPLFRKSYHFFTYTAVSLPADQLSPKDEAKKREAMPIGMPPEWIGYNKIGLLFYQLSVLESMLRLKARRQLMTLEH